MKRFVTLVRWEYGGMFWPLCVIGGVMALMQGAFFFASIRSAQVYVPFSTHLAAAQVPILALAAFLALLALIGVRMAMKFSPSRSIYALLTLPYGRSRVYLAKLAAYLLAAATLVAVQMAVLLVFNAVLGSDEGRRGADFFLALLEIPLLRTILPTVRFPQVMAVTAVGGSVCVALFVAASVRAMKLIPPIICTVVWIGLLLIVFPLTESTTGGGALMLFFMLVTVFSGVRMGMDLYESGEVA